MNHFFSNAGRLIWSRELQGSIKPTCYPEPNTYAQLYDIAFVAVRNACPTFTRQQCQEVASRAAVEALTYSSERMRIDAMERIILAAQFDIWEDLIDGSDWAVGNCSCGNGWRAGAPVRVTDVACPLHRYDAWHGT